MFERSAFTLARIDPEIASVIERENRRQEEHIELIASENYTSPAVMAAQGSQLTNKYAEGYAGTRHDAGCARVASDGTTKAAAPARTAAPRLRAVRSSAEIATAPAIAAQTT